MESKERRDESRARNVPFPAQYHLGDVILRADILVYPCSLEAALPISTTRGFPALCRFLPPRVSSAGTAAAALRKAKIAQQFGRKAVAILTVLIWILNSLNSASPKTIRQTAWEDSRPSLGILRCCLPIYEIRHQAVCNCCYPPPGCMYSSAQMAGLLCEEEVLEVDNVKYCGYCKYHFNKMVSFLILPVGIIFILLLASLIPPVWL